MQADETSDRKTVKASKPSQKEETYVSGRAGARSADVTLLARMKNSVQAFLCVFSLYLHVLE